jgi:hypothetical protein
MLVRIAYFISLIFHPVCMPLYIYGLTVWLAPPSVMRYTGTALGCLAGVIVLFSVCVPAAFLWVMYRTRAIPTLTLEERRHRTLPYLVGIVSMLVLYYKLQQAHIAPLVYVPVLGGAVVGVGLLCINFFYKISAHAACIGAWLGFLWGAHLFFNVNELYLYILLMVILMMGLVGSARLYINAHTPTQVWFGYALGILLMYFSVFFLTNN